MLTLITKCSLIKESIYNMIYVTNNAPELHAFEVDPFYSKLTP